MCKSQRSGRNKKNEVWENSFDWKECRTNRFMKQTLDYMHDNPCRGKWNLMPDVTEYKHSSARFYLCGEQGVYPVMNYLELEDIDLMKLVSVLTPSPRQRTNPE